MNFAIWTTIVFFPFHTILSVETTLKVQWLKQDEYVKIRIKPKQIKIECSPYLETLRVDDLPNFTINATKLLKFEDCPLPRHGLQELLHKFALTEVKSLEFNQETESTSNNSVLERHYFQGLTSLRKLKLSENGITVLDEDVFVDTPNLQILELDDNNITLTPNLFRSLSKLIFLDLSGNSLESLPVGVFDHLKKLKTLSLFHNHLTRLDESIFQGLVSLKTLELSTNQIEVVPEKVFQRLTNLVAINLSFNRIKRINPGLFKNNLILEVVKINNNNNVRLSDYLFANSSLREIELNNCNISTLPEHIFENSKNLKAVKLHHNRLKVIPEGLFKGLVGLNNISLRNNQIENIDKVFDGMTHLRLLSLANNLISTLPVFVGLTNLRKLHLKGNKIQQISPGSLYKLTTLRSLNLANNYITTVKLAELISSNISINLDSNQITLVDLKNVTTTASKISLRNNPINCDCESYDLVSYFQNSNKSVRISISAEDLKCGGPPEVVNVSLTDLSLSNLTCPLEKFSKNYAHCPDKCLCTWRPHDTSIVIDCKNQNLTSFPLVNITGIDFVPFNQTEIHLEDNHLKVLPTTLAGFDNVTKLFLSRNKIEEVLSLPPKLEVLELDYNNITRLNKDAIRALNRTSSLRLALDENPWLCDCDSESLTQLLRNLKNSVVRNVRCSDNNEQLINLYKSDLCVNWNTTVWLTSLSFLLIVLIFIALFFFYKQEIKIFLFSKNLCLWWVTEEDLDKDKPYDAFISYSHKDEELVQEIVRFLENGPESYKLCLHYRDWIPGELITTQITNSVRQSRRTVVILSNNFLESEWAKMEFQEAYSDAMRDKRTKVIIVLYGDIVNNLDKELKLYLNINTYVEWGDQYFWDKLKYALPHRKTERERRKRLTSDNFRLIHSIPSTPDHEFNFAQGGKLNFVPPV